MSSFPRMSCPIRFWIFLLFLSKFQSFIGDSRCSEISQCPVLDRSRVRFDRLGVRSYTPIPLERKGSSIVISLNGTVSLVESDSRNVIWSYASGDPMYRWRVGPVYWSKEPICWTYGQVPTEYDCAIGYGSGVSSPFFFDCGDDWAPYTKLDSPEQATALSNRVWKRPSPPPGEDPPLVGMDTSMFAIDPVSGELIDNRYYLPSYGLLLYITRFEFKLATTTTFSHLREVSWGVVMSEFQALLICLDDENGAHKKIRWSFQNNN